MVRTEFFRECLAKGRGESLEERRQWRQCIDAEILGGMRSQRGLSIQPMCDLAGVSRASFYRNWEEREPTAAEMELRIGCNGWHSLTDTTAIGESRRFCNGKGSASEPGKFAG